ncbi:GNAT family N-acetyltransferase [Paraburkholderia sediminicola]|jgi:acetyl CoA:N6-hydroxylysine acetyl transferase|uniref:GNAT family N-acetyltransferase n=1 Tax=Paraburkholderia TaxID=1822464 RepID=UPI0038BC2EFE
MDQSLTLAPVREASAATESEFSSFSHTLPDGRVCRVQILAGGSVALHVDGEPQALLTARFDATHVSIESLAGDADSITRQPPEIFLPLFAEYFARPAHVSTIEITLPVSHAWAVEAVRRGIFDECVETTGGCRLRCRRASFWQHPALWLRAVSSAGFAQRFTLTHHHRHPVRPPKPRGVVYERQLPHLDLTFSLRTIDVERDLELFNRWMNLPNVASVWDQADDSITHARFLADQEADPHTQTLFGCFNGEPFAYFEVYWVKEDRLAPFCDAGDYDRGIHILVGNRRHQGPAKLEAWLRSLFHYVFLDEPRTRVIYGEPRIDNARWIAYMQEQGGMKLKEFDFPHKRAALVGLSRETYFEEFGPR